MFTIKKKRIVTIAILGILAAMAIPAFSVWLPNYKLKSAARDLYSNFQSAKLGAIKENMTWAIEFNDDVAGSGKYRIWSCGPDGTWTGGGDDTQKKPNTGWFELSAYGYGVDFGHGNANNNIPGDPFGANISYSAKRALFGARGTANKLGYVYLSNVKGTTFGVGTPTTAGVIVLRKFQGGTWQ